MTSTLETIAARLQTLEDIEAIRQLIASYGIFADCGDSDAVSQLWTTGGAYEVSGFASAQGHGEIAALIDGETHRALMASGCAHLLGPVMVDLDGDMALARGHSLVFRHDEGKFIVHRVSANRWVLARDDTGWRVVRRTNALLDGTAEARILLGASPDQPAS